MNYQSTQLIKIAYTMFLVNFASVNTLPVKNHSVETSSLKKNITLESELFSRNDQNTSAGEPPGIKIRRKRQGSGKFMDASSMPPAKLLAIVLQMIRNVFASAYVGAPHPMHWSAPKDAVLLVKDTFESMSPSESKSKDK